MLDAAPVQKSLGAYYTPPVIARYLAGWAIRRPTDRVLDPGCGEGVFLAAAEAQLQRLGGSGYDHTQLLGIDLNATALETARRVTGSALIEARDFFELESEPRFDAVIGNPPYIRYHYFAGDARSQGLKRAEAEGVRLSSLTSSWAPFVVHASTFLASGGRLALLLPAELLTTDYAKPVRDYLLRRFASVDVVAFEQRVFPGAMVDTVLLLAEGQGPGHYRVHRLHGSDELVGFELKGPPLKESSKWTQGLLDDRAADAFARAAEAMIPLGHLATVDIGLVTGANSFFVLSEGDVRSHGLSRATLKPLIAKGHHIPGYRVSSDHWDALRARGEPVWLFTPRARSGRAGQYIDQGEALGVHEAYKCRVRTPWWRLKLLEAPDLILSYMSNRAPRLVANSAGVLTTNLLHNVRLMIDVSAEVMALAWPNSATLLSAELAGRAYGGGVLKLETKEAEGVWVPRITEEVAKELRLRAQAIDCLLSIGQLSAAADLVDPVVLSDVGVDDRSAMRSAWLDLCERRRRRSTPAQVVSKGNLANRQVRRLELRQSSSKVERVVGR